MQAAISNRMDKQQGSPTTPTTGPGTSNPSPFGSPPAPSAASSGGGSGKSESSAPSNTAPNQSAASQAQAQQPQAGQQAQSPELQITPQQIAENQSMYGGTAAASLPGYNNGDAIATAWGSQGPTAWESPQQIQQSNQQYQQSQANANYNFDGRQVTGDYLKSVINSYNPNISNALQPGMEQEAQAAEKALQTGSGSFSPQQFAPANPEGRNGNQSAQQLGLGLEASGAPATLANQQGYINAVDPGVGGSAALGPQNLSGATYNPTSGGWTLNGPAAGAGQTTSAPSAIPLSGPQATQQAISGAVSQGQSTASPSLGGGQTTASPSTGSAAPPYGAGPSVNPTPLTTSIPGSQTNYTSLPTTYGSTVPVGDVAASNLGMNNSALNTAITQSLSGNTALTPTEQAGYGSNTQTAEQADMAMISPFMDAIKGTTAGGMGIGANSGLSNQVIATNFLPQMMANANNVANTQQGAANSSQQNTLAEVLAAALRPNSYASPMGTPSTAGTGGANISGTPDITADITGQSTTGNGTTNTPAQNLQNGVPGTTNPNPLATQPTSPPFSIGGSPGGINYSTNPSTGQVSVSSNNPVPGVPVPQTLNGQQPYIVNADGSVTVNPYYTPPAGGTGGGGDFSGGGYGYGVGPGGSTVFPNPDGSSAYTYPDGTSFTSY
jgi:hypothetical protein